MRPRSATPPSIAINCASCSFTAPTTTSSTRQSQSGAFLTALGQAQFFVRRIIIPGAGHFWSADPFENEPTSYGAAVAPRLLQFLEGSL